MRRSLVPAVLVLVLAVACSGAPEAPDAQPVPNMPTIPVSVQDRESGLSRPDLDVAYRDCLLEQGFDPEGVQVLVDGAGVPWWVKTGHNVPADLHGPCFQEIGGAETDRPSWGVAVDDR